MKARSCGKGFFGQTRRKASMSLNVQPPPESSTVREAIDRMAEIRGDAVFLIDPERNRRLTFRQIRDRASQFCSRLLAQGVNPGDRVASLLDNSLFAAESLLGAMYGGFVPVPLNPSAGPSEIDFALEQSEPKVLFIAPECDSLLRSIDCAARRLAVEIIDGHHDSILHSERCAPGGRRRGRRARCLYLRQHWQAEGRAGFPSKCHRRRLEHRRRPSTLRAGLFPVRATALSHERADRHLDVHLAERGIGRAAAPVQRAHFWRWISEERCTWSALVLRSSRSL